jgi:hypothetical protein
MVRKRDTRRRDVWRERLGRFEQCGGTVAEFCRREAVSAATFYAWRARLKAEVKAESQAAPRASFVPVRLPEVVPEVVPGPERLEIELPNGAVVRVVGANERLARLAIETAGSVAWEARAC